LDSRFLIKAIKGFVSMDFDNLLGFIAATITTAAFIPQTYRSITTRDLSGISLGMYATFTFGIILWIIYGILIGSGPILVANYFVFKNSAPDGTSPR
jgi:MtN3 and saliva related transmembrane protein